MKLTDEQYVALLAILVQAEDYQSEDPTPHFKDLRLLIDHETELRGYADYGVAYYELVMGL